MQPANETGTSRRPGSRLELFSGYVLSALTPKGILEMSSESRMHPLIIIPCFHRYNGLIIGGNEKHQKTNTKDLHSIHSYGPFLQYYRRVERIAWKRRRRRQEHGPCLAPPRLYGPRGCSQSILQWWLVHWNGCCHQNSWKQNKNCEKSGGAEMAEALEIELPKDRISNLDARHDHFINRISVVYIA